MGWSLLTFKEEKKDKKYNLSKHGRLQSVAQAWQTVTTEDPAIDKYKNSYIRWNTESSSFLKIEDLQDFADYERFDWPQNPAAAVDYPKGGPIVETCFVKHEEADTFRDVVGAILGDIRRVAVEMGAVPTGNAVGSWPFPKNHVLIQHFGNPTHQGQFQMLEYVLVHPRKNEDWFYRWRMERD